jgi:hypothetical protein
VPFAGDVRVDLLLAVAGRPAAMLVVLPMPLPVRATVVGLLLALLVTVRVPGTRPPVVGLKADGHRAGRADREGGAVVGLAEVTGRRDAETVADVVPELVTVTVCAVAEVEPTTVPGEGQARRVRRSGSGRARCRCRTADRVGDPARGDGQVAGTAAGRRSARTSR